MDQHRRKVTMSKSAHTPGWLKHFKRKVDFFDLLAQQAETTLGGLRGLHEWLKNNAKGECTAVHELEHKADRQKQDISQKLRDTMVTPFDREDIYDLSAEMDLIINGAKRFVKDVEFLHEECSDKHLLKMSEALAQGCEHILTAIQKLRDDLEAAADAAHKARKTETAVEQIYREGLTDLFVQEDIETRAKSNHLYNCMVTIAERVERLGEKLLHISMKLG